MVVDFRLVPYLAADCMVSKLVDFVRQPVVVDSLDRLYDARVENAALFAQQALIGNVARERVSEPEFHVGKQADLVQKSGRLEVGERVAQCIGTKFRHCLEQRLRHIEADNRRGLKQVFLLVRQPIDTRRQHCLDRRRYLQVVDSTGGTVSTGLTDQYLCFGQSAGQLLEEKWIALSTLDQDLAKRHQGPIGTQQRLEQFIRTCRGQGCEWHFVESNAVLPVMHELRSVFEDEHQPRGVYALDQAIQEDLRFGVHPLQILKDDQHWLTVTLFEDDAGQRNEDVAATRSRVQRPERIILRQSIQQRQDWRAAILEFRVDADELGHDLISDLGGSICVFDLEVPPQQLDDREVRVCLFVGK